MFESKIIADDSATAGTADVGAALGVIRLELSNVASRIDARFVEAGTTLGTMLETIDALMQRLDGMTGVLGADDAGAAVAELTDAARLISELPQRSACRNDIFVGIRQTVTHLEDGLGGIHKILSALRILSVNIRIVAVEEPTFDKWVDSIGAQLSAGEDELTPLVNLVNRLKQDVWRVEDVEGQLSAETAKVLPAAPNRLLRDAQTLVDYQDMIAKTVTSVADIARGVQSRVAQVLVALQVGDNARQRIEHIASGLALLEDHLAHGESDEASARQMTVTIVGLLAEQLADTMDSLQKEIAELGRSMQGIAQDARSLLSISGNGDQGSVGSTILQSLNEGINIVEQLTLQLRETNGEVSGIVRNILIALDGLNERIRVVAELRDEVEQVAINVRLRCQHARKSGPAIGVIATEVRRYSGQLNDTIQTISKDLADLGTLNESLRNESDLADQVDIRRMLEQSLRAIGQGCEAVNSSLDGALEDSSAAIDLISSATLDLDGRGDLNQALQRMLLIVGEDDWSAPIEDAASAQAKDQILATIFKSYTMARERDIHLARSPMPDLPIQAETAAAAPAGDDDDFDDIFL
ncbi:hypothetical protein [Novosphingobium sp. JCM 18896]|uniref:hypothetical protein n=1 Tax=Novosphingobium sp. JCM 18896 TaxID=2989731 RepID=UPI0022223F89|nr:hypothetical protein [Novosphingobium sp. JCM 18896]MCW1427781.1 hypothetical protein [Novosphingobium sp. JCM 18896]